ncbi:MAG: hypothetical protein HFF47_01415 [Lawsonibacter sp.]|jgi:hypothetical protein|nr:hypothetical protein [Lawsonibacter sp.]
MKAIFKVGDKDFTRFLEEGGIKWSRNDVDSELTKRSKLTAKMYRKRLATKRKLSITCKRMTTAEVHELNQAILPEKISVTYLDPLEGQVVTKEFYGSSVDATTQISMGDETYWDGVGFNIIEM